MHACTARCKLTQQLPQIAWESGDAANSKEQQSILKYEMMLLLHGQFMEMEGAAKIVQHQPSSHNINQSVL